MLARSHSVIRARAPLRLGLAGGGTDLSPYCDEYGGAILNITIDRFAYAFVETRKDHDVVFRSKDLRLEETLPAASVLPDAKLLLHRGVYERMIRDYNDGVPVPVTITTTVDAPLGSGLGSSSALVVALIEAFRTLLGIPLGEYEIAQLAFEIERVDLGLPGGRQDQYSAAFGGSNFIEFFADNRAIVNPLKLPDNIRNEFEASLVVCFAGGARDANSIIARQIMSVADHNGPAIEAMNRLKADAIAMKNALLLGDIYEMARLLKDSWAAKKLTASGISNDGIDRLCDLAFRNGALAGKVSGAGGGGFLMFIVPPEERLDLIGALNNAGCIAEPVQFSTGGCENWRGISRSAQHGSSRP